MTLVWFRFDLEVGLGLDYVACSAWVKAIFDTLLQMVLQLFNPQPISLISEAQFIMVCENWCKFIPSEIFTSVPISQSFLYICLRRKIVCVLLRDSVPYPIINIHNHCHVSYVSTSIFCSWSKGVKALNSCITGNIRVQENFANFVNTARFANIAIIK